MASDGRKGAFEMFRLVRARRLAVASAAAVLSIVLVAGVVLARAPLTGTQDYNWTRNSVLTYKFSGTYDGWSGSRAAVD